MSRSTTGAFSGLGLLVCAAAIAGTQADISMPSAHEYFRQASMARICGNESSIDTPGLRALRHQALDYYRTKAAQDATPDPLSSQAADQLDANVIPNSVTEEIRIERASLSATDRAAQCRANDASVDQLLARNALAMASVGWPGAKPLDQARAEAMDLGVTSIYRPARPQPKTALPVAGSVLPTARIRVDDPTCRPSYPEAAVRAQATGVSRLRFTIDARGNVVTAEIIQSSGPTREHRMLDNSAKFALATCPIKPAVDANGVPVASTVELTYTWKLD